MGNVEDLFREMVKYALVTLPSSPSVTTRLSLSKNTAGTEGG